MNAYEFIIRLKDQATSGLRQLASSVGATGSHVRELNDELDQTSRKSKALASGISALKGAFLGIVAGLGTMSFVNQIISARKEYEKFQLSLTNTLQSASMAKSALEMVTDFAVKTPFKLDEVTGSFTNLVNKGIVTTKEELKNLGDLAASQENTFEHMTDAFVDSLSGQYGKLNDFGINVQENGSKLLFTFRGVTKEIDNNSSAIKKAILDYGKLEGVTGSMSTASRTLEGMTNVLQNRFQSFLMKMGELSSPIFEAVFLGMSKGLDFLTYSIQKIVESFGLLWKSISPVITSLWEFIKAAFSFGEAGGWVTTFGNIISGVLLIVDYFSVGFMTLIEILEPFAPLILTIAGAWAVFNAILAISPIGWITIAIVGLSIIIGMIIKYTSGWGKSWQALCTLLGAVWKQIKSDFNLGVETIKTAFKLIGLYAQNTVETVIGKFVNLGKGIEMALSGDFSGAYDKAFETVVTKADKEIERTKNALKKLKDENSNLRKETSKEISDSFKNIGISIDTEGAKKDFKKIKDQFSLAGQKNDKDNAYNAFATSTAGALGGGRDLNQQKNKENKRKDGIVSGGAKQTNFYITIDSVGKEITINIDNTEKGVSTLGEKVREELLRAINSINHLQS